MSSSRLAIGLVSIVCLCSSATLAAAQRSGDWTEALRSLPLDPGALGMPGRAYLEYSGSESSVTAGSFTATATSSIARCR